MTSDIALDTAARRTVESLEALLALPEDSIERGIKRRSVDKGREGSVSREVNGAPLDTSEMMPWAAAGLCRHSEGDWFDIPVIGWKQQRAAKTSELAICQVCPVRRDCLEHALRFNEPAGIWGGLVPRERAKLRRERRRP